MIGPNSELFVTRYRRSFLLPFIIIYVKWLRSDENFQAYEFP